MMYVRKPAFKIKAVTFPHWRILRGDRVEVLSGKNKVSSNRRAGPQGGCDARVQRDMAAHLHDSVCVLRR
jgi:hypothetical protein